MMATHSNESAAPLGEDGHHHHRLSLDAVVERLYRPASHTQPSPTSPSPSVRPWRQKKMPATTTEKKKKKKREERNVQAAEMSKLLIVLGYRLENI